MLQEFIPTVQLNAIDRFYVSTVGDTLFNGAKNWPPSSS
jgi:hypothetical protein